MYAYFSDLHVDLLSHALLQPGEQRVGQTVTRYLPWWALGLINRTYLVIATDRRVIVLEHRMAWLHQSMKLRSVESTPWANVGEARVTGLFTKKLRLRGNGPSGPLALKTVIPNAFFGLLAPMRNNMAGARAIANAFQATRAMVGQPTPQALPQSYAPQALPQAYAQPAQLPYAQPQTYAMPPQNSPGYASVPPPSAQPQRPSAPPPPLPPRARPPYATR